MEREMDKIVQAFAVQTFTAALDISQQVEPVASVDALEARAKAIASDAGQTLLGLSLEQVDQILYGKLFLHITWPYSDLYDPAAVGAAIQMRMKSGLEALARVDAGADSVELVHGMGEYLASMDDHKLGYLIEKAASLIVIAAGD